MGDEGKKPGADFTFAEAVALAASSGASDAELAGFKTYPADIGGIPAAMAARAARVVLVLRQTARLIDELRDLDEPTLEPVRLALEASRIVVERKNAEHGAILAGACRKILDESWEPSPFARIGDMLPTDASVLRAAEAHRLLDRSLNDAIMALSDLDGSSAQVREAFGETYEDFERFSRPLAPRRVLGVLELHVKHFPGGAAARARAEIVRWGDPEYCAHLEPVRRRRRALRAVLVAWGSPERVIKHVERTLQRKA